MRVCTAQALAAVATALVAFLAAFACFELLFELAIGLRTLVMLSRMPGFSFGIIGLIGIQLPFDLGPKTIVQTGRYAERPRRKGRTQEKEDFT